MSNPVTSTDRIFLKHFAMLIGFLAIVAVILMALGAHIYANHPPEQVRRPQQAVSGRIAPVGAVYAGDTGRAAMRRRRTRPRRPRPRRSPMAARPTARRSSATSATAATRPAPAARRRSATRPPGRRASREGLDTLVKHAIEGFTGKSGIMPAKGGNPALTDEQVKATVTGWSTR